MGRSVDAAPSAPALLAARDRDDLGSSHRSPGAGPGGRIRRSPMDGEADLGAYDLLMIHQLLGYYGHVVDDRDWDRFAELFTPDATLDYTRAGAPTLFHG